ncbi:MAG: S8 family serine peptidase [Phycisphaerae bacterium]|nr:S8 family serine peptidase [Phycisphaerae bacterium]
MRRKWPGLLILCVGAAFAPLLHATEIVPLELRAVIFQPEPGDNLLVQPHQPVDIAVPYLLRLDGPITPERRAALAGAGVAVGDFIPPDGFVARLDGQTAASLAALDFVTWLGPINPEWKIAPALQDMLQGGDPPGDPDPVSVVISTFLGESDCPILQVLQTHDARNVASHSAGGRVFVSATVSLPALPALVQLPGVQFIEPAAVLGPRNDSNGWILQSNVPGSTPVWQWGLLGQGQIAGLIDSGIDRDHCAFRDPTPIGPWNRKIVAIRGDAVPDAHGTYVAGTLAGDAEVIGQPDGYDGTAPLARISFTDFALIQEQPLCVYARLADAHADGARVHGNSWGDDSNNEYTALCSIVDAFAYDHEDSLLVFAVTNELALRSPENAKNVLAVGASMDAPEQDEFYSGGTGPTLDGRRKPEIFAPGCGTWSAQYDGIHACEFNQWFGTSMAAPAIAGAGLLVRQYFMEGRYPPGGPPQPFLPSAALVKAVLLNGAVDMTGVPAGGNEYPSNQEGWGRLVLDNALAFPGDARKLWVYEQRNAGGLQTGEQWSSPPVHVQSGAAPLRITLVFTEPPGAPMASNPVLNNLNLELIGPQENGTATYRGNWFSGGQSVSGGASDSRNNVEQILLPDPTSGTYGVTIHAAQVNAGRQGFALVISGNVVVDPLVFPDCNENGILDTEDIVTGVSQDCQTNGIPDECESLTDCNSNGTPDECESLPDCNLNGVPDPCEPALDCNGNSVPDECEGLPDCNHNGIPDSCDVLGPFGADCQPDGIPDECQVPLGIAAYAGPPGIFVSPPYYPSQDSRTLTVEDHYVIADVDLELQIEHEWNGDLIVQLAHADVTATVIHRPGYPIPNPYVGYGDTGFNVVLDDWTGQSIEHATAAGYGAVAGTYRPHPDLLSVFNGLDAHGPWTVTLLDPIPSFAGKLNAWELRIGTRTGPPPGCERPGDCTGDGYVNEADYLIFADCLAGPLLSISPECQCADLNGDGCTDLLDFAGFQGSAARSETVIITRKIIR